MPDDKLSSLKYRQEIRERNNHSWYNIGMTYNKDKREDEDEVSR